ncbi:MAG: valine--tRNA ligase [bacterium]
MEKAYNHKQFEDEIYKKWEASGAFTPKIQEGKQPFVISMPPANVTGKLHIGHGMYVTLEDIMIRYHRMKGEPSLWIPGTDHAGIATQSVVDKALRKRDINRHDLGREKFVEEVWKWKEEYGSTITSQIRKIGASCDWTRERFTLDEGLTLAVNEAFVKFYEKGLIYRGEYIVNWCPKCGTAISDDEVEHTEQKAKLYYFKYDKDFPITIATTRPETKLGDTAVAVNTADKRHEKYVGQEFEVNLDGIKRKIKVIADRTIDKDFGTGAVGVTPSHSMADWRLAEQYDLKKIKIINERGRITNTNEKYDGLKVLEARKKLVEYLKKDGLLEKEEEFENNLSICYRCNGSIEPLPSLQWFVKMKPLAEKAKKAVQSGEIKIMPKHFEKVYYHWLDNIRDWCISRQLWWGHRLPVWYKKSAVSDQPSAREAVKSMGFADTVVPQVFESKTQTWRVRDHELSVGDRVYFENSGSDEIFGYGVINKSEKRKVKDMPLQDKAHGAVYEKLDELIDAFKKFNPDKIITPDSDAWIYGYEFVPKEKFKKIDIEFAESWPLKADGSPEIYVGKETPTGEGWVQDEDVLDTWFSSGLWPFSTLGWPRASETKPEAPHSLGAVGPSYAKATEGKTDECKSLGLKYAPGITNCDYSYFFPTTVLETGYDILFFWVARMIMMSLELTGKAPFKTVYLHGLVRDEKNRKMSKSLGNVIDPIDIIDKFGADALRYSLIVGSTPGNDVALGESKIRGYRNFSNKIWNISRFVITNLESSKKCVIPGADPESRSPIAERTASDSRMTKQDTEDLAKLDDLVNQITKLLDELKFSQAGELLYDYTWHEFADKIIEREKERLYGDDKSEKQASLLKLTKILTTVLKMLHPYMPFVTEACWQELPKENKDSALLISASWPE